MKTKPFHFYASSQGEWQVANDIEDLIKRMKRSGLNFTLWKVPGDTSATYEIRNFAPEVRNRQYLGTYQLHGDKSNTWKMLCEDAI